MKMANISGSSFGWMQRALVLGLLLTGGSSVAGAFQETADKAAAEKATGTDSRTADGKSKTSPETAAQREAIISAFVKEINDLTPGGIEKDKDLKAAVRAAAEVFIEDASRALEQLERLRKAYPTLPPGSLLVVFSSRRRHTR